MRFRGKWEHAYSRWRTQSRTEWHHRMVSFLFDRDLVPAMQWLLELSGKGEPVSYIILGAVQISGSVRKVFPMVSLKNTLAHMTLFWVRGPDRRCPSLVWYEDSELNCRFFQFLGQFCRSCIRVNSPIGGPRGEECVICLCVCIWIFSQLVSFFDQIGTWLPYWPYRLPYWPYRWTRIHRLGLVADVRMLRITKREQSRPH